MPGVPASPEERKLRAAKKRAKGRKDTRPTAPNRNGANGTGRPTLKTPELCTLICERVAKGETLTSICNEPLMPDFVTVHRWTRAAGGEEFRNELARARESQAEVWAEETKELSDAELQTHEEIGRARLRMQARQWLAGKYNATYADKPGQTQINVGVSVVLPEAERAKLIERRDKALLANKQGAMDSQSTVLPKWEPER